MDEYSSKTPTPPQQQEVGPPRLEYEAPRDRDQRENHPSAVAAALACIPGALCWTILLASAAIRFFPRRPPRVPPAAMVAVAFAWVFLLVSGLIAVFAYVDRPGKPWYVVLSLVINISGLAVTLLFFCLLLYPNS